MGCKRPFEEMEFEELRFKHPRQLEYNNKPALFSDLVSCYNTPQDLFTIGKDEGGSCKFQRTEIHENDADVKTNKSLSLVVNGSTGEEDTGFGGPFEGAAFAHRSEFGFPRMPFAPRDDAYASSLNCSPRRHIPVGPNHQATIPIWREKECEENTKGVENSNEERLMGKCVIPMPDSTLPTQESGGVGVGRVECCCLDGGSIRCARQHIRERWECLRKSLGEKSFVNLGFYEMGEEVSGRWSEEEELDFHEVVYSNPASLGRDFWSRLSAVFSSRSKKEIVSYYFNVFMLRKRASQNRSRSLDIDSDDDEWHGSNGPAIQDSEDEEDDSSGIDSLGDQHRREEGLSEEKSEDSDDDDDDDVVRDHHGVVDQVAPKSFGECQFDPVDGISEDRFRDDSVFQDDSCMSFESQQANNGSSDSCGHVNENTKPRPDSKPVPGSVDHLYLSDSLDSKVWDFNATRHEKSFDLLPWDMIEDIFGDGKDEGKTKDN